MSRMLVDNASTAEHAAKALGLRLGAPLAAPVGERPLSLAWRARAAEGAPIDAPTRALFVAKPSAPADQRRRYVEAADRIAKAGELPRAVIRVHAVSRESEAFVTDLWTLGCARDVGALGWSAARRIDFVRQVAEALEALHRAGIVHGCLCDENILLDDELRPVVTEAGAVSVHDFTQHAGNAAAYGAFAAPESLEGGDVGVPGDVFALGRLLQHVLRSDQVPQAEPIVRRCLAPAPADRYESARAVAEAIAGAVADLGVEVVSKPALHAAGSGPAGSVAVLPAVPSSREGPDTSWMTPVGGGFVIVAVVIATLGFGGNGALPTMLSIVLVAGVAMCVFALRPTQQAPPVLRAGFALTAAAAVAAIDPLAYAYRSAAERALRGSAGARRAAIAEIVRLGRDFQNMALAGVDLRGLDLRGADLRGADLSQADLTGADLVGAKLGGAWLTGTKLAGADLRQTDLERARFESARCDARTLVPVPLRCAEGVLTAAPRALTVAPAATVVAPPSLESDASAR